MKLNSLLGKHLKKCLKKESKHFHVPRMLLTVLVVSAFFAAVPQKAFSSDTGGTDASTAVASNAAAGPLKTSESSVRPLHEKYATGLDTGCGRISYLNY